MAEGTAAWAGGSLLVLLLVKQEEKLAAGSGDGSFPGRGKDSEVVI